MLFTICFTPKFTKILSVRSLIMGEGVRQDARSTPTGGNLETLVPNTEGHLAAMMVTMMIGISHGERDGKNQDNDSNGDGGDNSIDIMIIM